MTVTISPKSTYRWSSQYPLPDFRKGQRFFFEAESRRIDIATIVTQSSLDDRVHVYLINDERTELYRVPKRELEDMMRENRAKRQDTPAPEQDLHKVAV